MDNIEIRKLDCGVRVAMEEIPYVKSAAFGIWVKNGAVNETPEVAGISHFIEHMMFKGTSKKRTADSRGCGQDRRTDECFYRERSNLLLCKDNKYTSS